MSQVLEQGTVLVVLCVMLKQSFVFFPPLYWGVKAYGKMANSELRAQNSEELSIQYSLSCPPITILCLWDSFLSLLLLPTISNLHAPILECTNLLYLGSQQNSLQKVSPNKQILCRHNFQKKSLSKHYFCRK